LRANRDQLGHTDLFLFSGLHIVWFDLLSSGVHDSDRGQLFLPSQLHTVWINLLVDHQLYQLGHPRLHLLSGLHTVRLHLH
jgi:hypothetical protein